MPDQIAHRQRINYLLSETEAIYHEASLRLGLSDSEMKILYSIRDKKSAVKRPLKEILVFSGMAKQTANSALRKMENAGWLFLEGGQKNKTVCLTQKGVEVAMFLHELAPQEFKVSLRSKGKVDVSKIASYFGGGGHVRAAGVRMHGSSHDVINNITGRIVLQLDHSGSEDEEGEMAGME